MATSKKTPKKYTKAELREMILIKSPDAKIPTKATVATLTKIYTGLTMVVKEKSGKQRASSKDQLRLLFTERGRVTTADVEAIAQRLGVKKASVLTAISDLKSKKYAQGPALQIEKDGDDYVLSA